MLVLLFEVSLLVGASMMLVLLFGVFVVRALFIEVVCGVRFVRWSQFDACFIVWCVEVVW